MLRTITAGTAMLAALAIPSAAVAKPQAPQGPPSDPMTIGVVKANGSGCPDGTTDVLMSKDNTSFTVTYSAYTALVGPEATKLDARKNCQLALDVNVPSGFTYAVAKVDYRGYADLAKGATGSQSASYYFSGMSQTVRSKHNLKGPMEGYWQKSDAVGVLSLNFLPCGDQRYLQVNTDLRVNGGWSNTKKVTSLVTMDSTDLNLKTVYQLAWKSCK